MPRNEVHHAIIEELRVTRGFELVLVSSSILARDANLAAAARHVRAGGRLGMELMNPHWIAHGDHAGLRVAGGGMEVDYTLPDGSVVTLIVDQLEGAVTAPEQTEERLGRHWVELEWMGGRPDDELTESPDRKSVV